MTLPTIVTSAGLQPTPPAVIRAGIVADVSSTNPGYTADLPGSMIEDILSTIVAAVVECDTARVETVNSLTPYGANAFLLQQLGQMFGVPLNQESNTSVFVQFTGTPGFVISKGFTVSDGTYQYTIIDGGIVGSDTGGGTGVTPLLFAVATITGSWAIPAGTVTSLSTSVPGGVTLTVTNPSAGIPSVGVETQDQYRAEVLNAQLATCSGTQQILKTLLYNVTGVQARLVSTIQLPLNGGWEIIVGGGDPYQVAYAIYKSGIDISSLVGSTLNITNITKANPGVLTTDKNHGITTGQTINITGSAVTAWNVTGATATVISPTTLSYGVNTSAFTTYTSGGVLTPNNRNISPSINDYPNTLTIPYVLPPQQSVTVTLTWNTSSVNFVSAVAVSQAGAPAIAAYINSIEVGQPINVFQMQEAFVLSVSSILDPSQITRMVFSVSINGVSTSPVAGTGIINGDPESYFLSSSSNITVTQG
jgi:hypothetical protein